MRRPAQLRGFTLVEALAVLAIMAVLVALGASGLRQLIVSQGIKTASFDLYAALAFARSEAITRNSSVTITPTSGSWISGWSITDASSATLRTQNARTNVTISGPASVTYNAMGRLTAAITAFSVSGSGASASDMRCVTVDLSGRPVVKSGACS